MVLSGNVFVRADRRMIKSSKTKNSGFSYEIRDDGIVVYYLSDLRRETVDDFVEVSHNMDIAAYESGRHSRCLLDISKLSFPTPYAVRRIQQNTEVSPDGLKESYAVLTPTSVIYTFARTVLSRLPYAKTQTIRLFHDEEEAYAWLEERLEALGP